MDGFYVAKFIKIKDGPKKTREEEIKAKNENLENND